MAPGTARAEIAADAAQTRNLATLMASNRRVQLRQQPSTQLRANFIAISPWSRPIRTRQARCGITQIVAAGWQCSFPRGRPAGRSFSASFLAALSFHA